jgi:hypothetical protein
MKTENLILRIVNRWIGVDGGYLGLPEENRFTYKSHKDFYPEYCDLIKDPDLFEGTTRYKFIAIFESSKPKEQSKIIRGVIERFPVGEGIKTRTKSLSADLLKEANRLDIADYVNEPNLFMKSENVLETLEDAKSLIENRKAVSAVDRVHTAFHGYLREICNDKNINFEQKDDLVALIKKIFSGHPKLKISVKSQEIQNIVKNLTSIADSLNPVRNQGSRAHPNEKVLEEAEAILVINTVRTVLTYFDSKIR